MSNDVPSVATIGADKLYALACRVAALSACESDRNAYKSVLRELGLANLGSTAIEDARRYILNLAYFLKSPSRRALQIAAATGIPTHEAVDIDRLAVLATLAPQIEVRVMNGQIRSIEEGMRLAATGALTPFAAC